MWRPRLEVRAAPEDGTGQGQGQGQGQEEDVRSCGKVTADGRRVRRRWGASNRLGEADTPLL